MDYRITRQGIVEHSHCVAGHWGGLAQWHRANIWHRNQPDAHRVYAATSSRTWLVLRAFSQEQADHAADVALAFAEATGNGVRRWSTNSTATGAPVVAQPTNLRTMSPRKFGVEIECIMPSRLAFATLVQSLQAQGVNLESQSYNHRSSHTTWKAVTDGSLRGARYPEYPIEIVSPVLSNSEGMRQLKAVCDGLQAIGARVNISCGLHVHHDASDLTLTDVQHLVVGYAGSQDAIDSFMRRYRRNSRWARPYGTRELANVDSALDIRSIHYDRYMAVNVQAYAVHGTIELRQFHATLSFNDISAWVRLGQSMVAAAQRGNRAWGSSLDEMLGNLLLNQADRRYFLNMASRRQNAARPRQSAYRY